VRRAPRGSARTSPGAAWSVPPLAKPGTLLEARAASLVPVKFRAVRRVSSRATADPQTPTEWQREWATHDDREHPAEALQGMKFGAYGGLGAKVMVVANAKSTSAQAHR
jgi:hypothetical protein